MMAHAPVIERETIDVSTKQAPAGDAADVLGEGDLFEEWVRRGWAVVDDQDDERVQVDLRSPDGAVYISWTPDNATGVDGHEPVCWTIAAVASMSSACPSCHSAPPCPPTLIHGAVTQRPLWTAQFAPSTPLHLIRHFVGWLEANPHGCPVEPAETVAEITS